MSTDQKLDLLLSEIAELKAALYGQKPNQMLHKEKKREKKETKEEITNRLLAKIRGAAEPERAQK